MKSPRWIEYLYAFLAGLVLGFILSILDASGNFLKGWLAYGLISSLAFISLMALWRWVGSLPWFAWLLAITFLLRLILGVTFSFIVPDYGYDTEVQNAGFIAIDAYSRDLQSWELASSDRPILDAFDKDYAIDQYGGLEAVSALIYRYLSPDFHRPWLIILLASWISAVGIAFLWQASRLVFDEKLSSLAVWLVAFYPETIWLGSSQMREPFLMYFIVIAFYGLVSWLKLSAGKGWIWLFAGFIGLLLFSPGISIFLVILLGGWAILQKGIKRIPWKALGLGFGIIVVALLLFWVAQAQGNLQGFSPWETISGWLKYTVRWDVYQLERDSGMIQYLFKNVLPPSLKIPFVFVYGLLQPVLPAAIFDAANGFWQIVGILRSLGWYLLVPLLIFSFQDIWKSARKSKNYAWVWLFLFAWIWIFISSLRAGGDQWDNPRYRTIFLAFQMLLASRAWLNYRQTRNPWFIRIILVEAGFVAIFSLWYASRYLSFIAPLSFPVMVGLILVYSFGVLVGGWILDRRRILRN